MIHTGLLFYHKHIEELDIIVVFFFIVVFHNPAEKERMRDDQGPGTKTEIKT